MIYRIDVEAVGPVNPTEDPTAVRQAIGSLLPDADIEHGHGEIVGRGHSIDRLTELFAKQRIQETARAALLESIDGDTIAFTVSKQAAHAGVVNFALDEPAELGDISVSIRVDQPSPTHLVETMTSTGGD